VVLFYLLYLFKLNNLFKIRFRFL